MAKPNYTPNIGGLATNRYDFEHHVDGLAFRHNAVQIDVNPAVYIAGVPYITVADALNAISSYVTSDELAGQGFIAVGDGYDTYHNANGNPNYDSTIPSLDTLLNPLFTYILNYYNNPNASTLAAIPNSYLRIKDGGVILVKAGTYIIKNTVTVPPGFIIMGEGFGTKIINKTSPTAPLFSVLSDNSTLNGLRQVDEGVTSGNADPNGIFMAARDTIFYNMVIGDNFVEPVQAGDTTYELPQNVPVYVGPSNAVKITSVSNASPIVITTSGAHGLSTGNTVTVANVAGNTAANGSWIITVSDSTHFSLNNSTGNGVYVTNTGNVYAFPVPLISQKEGSSIIIDNVKFVGKVSYATGKPSTATGTAIATDSTLTAPTGTNLAIVNSIFDGFTVPINFTASGNVNDRFYCIKNKIRAFGTQGSTTNNYGQNFYAGPIQMNTCNAKVSDNFIFTNFIDNSAIFGSTSNMDALQNNAGPSLVSVTNTNFQYYSVQAATNASPIEITTSVANTLTNGATVTIAGVGGNTAANGLFNVTVIDSTHFTLNNSTANGTYTQGGTVYVGSRKMNICISGNNITSISSAGKPNSSFYMVTYQPYNLTSLSSPSDQSTGSSLIASAINHSIYGNSDNVNDNLLSPVAYRTVNTGANSFYSFSGDETVILIPNIQELSFPVNLPQSTSVPGRIVTIKNTSSTGVASSSPTILVPWGPSLTVANTSGLGVSPIVITTTLPHNLANNAIVTIVGVNGNSAANGVYTITVINSTQFSLNGGTPAPTGNGNYTGGGIVYATDFIEGNQLPYSMPGDYQVVRLISDGTGYWWFI